MSQPHCRSGGDRLRVAAIVVIEGFERDRRGQLPGEAAVEAGPRRRSPASACVQRGCAIVMKALSGGSGWRLKAPVFWSCSAQPRKASRVPAVSLKPNRPSVAASRPPPSGCTAPSPSSADHLDLLADPAVDRRRRDHVGDLPGRAVMLERDRRPEHAGADRQAGRPARHRPPGDEGLDQVDRLVLLVLRGDGERALQVPGDRAVPDQLRLGRHRVDVDIPSPPPPKRDRPKPPSVQLRSPSVSTMRKSITATRLAGRSRRGGSARAGPLDANAASAAAKAAASLRRRRPVNMAPSCGRHG